MSFSFQNFFDNLEEIFSEVFPKKSSGNSFERKVNDLGSFSYSETGFKYRNSQEIAWDDITRIEVYKKDLFAVDLICMDIFYINVCRTFHEEQPGWHQFKEKLNEKFPDMPINWETEVVQPAFIENRRVIYTKSI